MLMNVQIEMHSSVKEIWNASILRDPSSVHVVMLDIFLIFTKHAKVGSFVMIQII